MESSKPKKLYRTVLVDPPWDVDQKGNRGAIQHYNLMTLNEIKNMPVSHLLESDAHIYLWVTNGTLRQG